MPNEEMLKRIRRMLDRTWGQIAPDAEEFVNESRSQKRRVETIVEFVLDADRYRTNGGDREAADAWQKWDKEDSDVAYDFAFETLRGYA